MGIVNTGDANEARFRPLLEGSQAQAAELISFKV